MRFAAYRDGDRNGLAASLGGAFHGLSSDDARHRGSLSSLVAGGTEGLLDAGRVLPSGPEVDLGSVTLLPPLPSPPRIVCVGLNCADHSTESGFKVPDYLTVFGRFASSLIGHNAPIVRRLAFGQLDYEGEFVAVIGKGGRNIPHERALDHVAA